jgi:hypothetical protein
MMLRWSTALTVIVLFAMVAIVHAAPRGGCGRSEGSITDKHTVALCRDLGRRAVKERPGPAWSDTWSDTCSFTSRTSSNCTFKLVWRDHSLPKADRRPARVCKGAAVVTGRTKFLVSYPEGCVYPAED